MMAARLLLIGMLALMASGCVTRQVQTLTSLPLPADQSLNCCWQALQQLDITYDKSTYKLTGALAQTQNGVTLVLLDPFGRRLLSVNKQGETITSYRSPELPEGLPERFLLASSMLVWWPLADWQTLLASQKTGWQITTNNSERVLTYGGKAVIRARYTPNSIAIIDGMNKNTVVGQEPVILQHEHQALSIQVVTQSLDAIEQAPSIKRPAQ